MRAMSLVSNEGDSEQNEIRNLQERLESTMSLVKQLSSQLAELKEQVSALCGQQSEHVWVKALPSITSQSGQRYKRDFCLRKVLSFPPASFLGRYIDKGLE
ncbi:hypothetical protein EK904_006996 [Melospiza melodia maxima]|nr:hypothetical protein EK904_006996 [Melospiza melodia maxima]